MISIIVPVYNGARTIARCLDSIVAAAAAIPFELIVVDDGSTDATAAIVAKYSCRYIKIDQGGVARARNTGAGAATGDILLFFDADVELRDDTIKNFLRHFEADKEAGVIQGRWYKQSLLPTFSSRFQLAKYRFNFLDMFKAGAGRVEAANLETGCLAIKRDIFKEFNGFDESYRFSGGEEHELGMRIAAKYKIYYYSDIFVAHGFCSLLNALPKIYRRTVNFAMLAFMADKGFVEQHRNSVPACDRRSMLILLFMFCALAVLPFNFALGAALFGSFFLLYAANIFNFIRFAAVEEGALFSCAAVLADILIMVPRFLGLVKAAYIFYILRKKDYRI